MTLANCERLLAHYEKVGNKEGAEEMRAKIALKGGQPSNKSASSKSK